MGVYIKVQVKLYLVAHLCSENKPEGETESTACMLWADSMLLVVQNNSDVFIQREFCIAVNGCGIISVCLVQTARIPDWSLATS